MSNPGPRIRIIRREIPSCEALVAAGVDPVLARVYAARGLLLPEELHPGLEALPDWETLPGAAQAAEVLAAAIRDRRRILVVGDFDADGATSTAIAVAGLEALGAEHVDYLVPNRFEYGHGLCPRVVALAAERGPDLILTVDNGVTSVAGVAAAEERGIRVVITDHHLPGEVLPAADAIVDPHLPGSVFPGSALAGCGVVFYLLAAVRSVRRVAGGYTQAEHEPRLAELLDLVALGTVADLVPLDAVNRILVAQGVKRIRAGRGRPGIGALLGVAGRPTRQMTATDLAYAVAPRLNAAGRLEDMTLGVECLLSKTATEARSKAARLDSLNRQRQKLERTMLADAMAHLDEAQQRTTGEAGLCVWDNRWHQGVVGLLAGRLKERFHRPVIAFAPAGEDGVLKGSARSVAGLHLRDMLAFIDSQAPGLIRRFGGHAMAAGLEIRAEDFQAFAAAWDGAVRARIPPDGLEPVLETDGGLEASERVPRVAQAIREGGPWGQAFPEPLFDDCFRIREQRVVGEQHLKLRLEPPEGGRLEAIAFRTPLADCPANGSWIRAAYRLDLDTFRGGDRIQGIIEHFAPES